MSWTVTCSAEGFLIKFFVECFCLWLVLFVCIFISWAFLKIICELKENVSRTEEEAAPEGKVI